MKEAPSSESDARSLYLKEREIGYQHDLRLLDSAQSCADGTFLQVSNQTCLSCNTGCATCSDLATCTSCSEGYSLTHSQNQSTTCNFTGACTISGQVYNNQTKKCQDMDCPTRCSNCFWDQPSQTSYCSYCEIGYELTFNQTQNRDNCKLVDCSQQGVYNVWHNSSAICDYCSQGCLSCTNAHDCSKCQQNYILLDYMDQNSHQIYQMCQANCSLGQYMQDEDKGTCSNCSINCTSCLNSSVCYECKNGSYLNQTLDSDNLQIASCAKCPQSNCRSCQANPMASNSSNTSVQCYYCEDGYMVDWTSGACVAAPTCPLTQYFDQTLNKCTQCHVPNCDSCGQFSNCTICSPGFTLTASGTCKSQCNSVGEYFNTTLGSCTKCADTDNCLQCSNGQSCAICKTGSSLFLNSSEGINKCAKCPLNCTYCSMNTTDNSTTCKLCDINFILNTTSGVCIPYKCPQAYFFDQLGQSCESCPSGCSSCNDVYNCTACPQQNQTLQNGTCVDACQWQMQDQLAKFNVSSYLYFNLTTTKCQNCSISNCNNCSSDLTLNLEKCSSCQFGYSLSADQQSCQAIDCSSKGVYQNGSLCGYCSQGCLNCSVNPTTCSQCMTDMIIDGYGKCLPLCNHNQFYNYTLQSCQTCGDDSCSLCDSTSGQCSYCELGKTLWNDTQSLDPFQLKCVSCPDNCQSCNLTKANDKSSLNCTQCNAYYKQNSLGQCISYDSCPSGQYFDSNCTKCSKCESSCQECFGNSSSCTSCRAGMKLIYHEVLQSSTCESSCSEGMFYNSTDQQCYSCSDSCSECSSTSNCATCQAGYGMIYDQLTQQNQTIKSEKNLIEGASCQACPTNCEQCLMNSSKQLWCVKCQPGYGQVIQDQAITCQQMMCDPGMFYDELFQSCRECPSFCSECNSKKECSKCVSSRFTLDSEMKCVDKCQLKSIQTQIFQYYNETLDQCQTCGVKNCNSCSNQTDCSSCAPGFNLFAANGAQICLACPQNCGDCTLTSDNSSTFCHSCQEGFEFQNGICSPIKCDQSGVYKISNQSSLCDYCQVKGCKNCSTRYSCNQCAADFYSFDNLTARCLPNCTNSTYLSSDHGCQSCSTNCTYCQNSTDCDLCAPGYYALSYFQKQNSNLLALWQKSGQACLNCGSGCSRCSLSYSDSDLATFLANPYGSALNLQPKCWQCSRGYNLNQTTGLCQVNTTCKSGTFFSNDSQNCQQCSTGCQNCSNLSSCSFCANGYEMKTSGLCSPNSTNINQTANQATQLAANSSAQSPCIPMQYFSPADQMCLGCSPNCTQCLSMEVCLSCAANNNLTFFWDKNSKSQESFCKRTYSQNATSNNTQKTNQTMPLNWQGVCEQENQYFSFDQKACIPCTEGCAVCIYDGSCLACRKGLNLIETISGKNLCAQSCPGNMVQIMTPKGELVCEACPDGCSKCNESQCFECSSGLYKFTNANNQTICLSDCPGGTSKDNATMMCSSVPIQNCYPTCKTCKGILETDCITCGPNRILEQETGTCPLACPIKQYLSQTDNQCTDCSSNCFSCAFNSTFCLSCPFPQVLDSNSHTCVDLNSVVCPSGQFYDSSATKCMKCDTTCGNCTSPGPTNCYTCKSGLLYVNVGSVASPQIYCLPSCPDGMYLNQTSNVCIHCPWQCDQCEVNSTSVFCTKCATSKFTTQDGQCVDTCPLNTVNSNGNCVPNQCSQNCGTCVIDICQSCTNANTKVIGSLAPLKVNYYKSQCFDVCPSGSYYSENQASCVACAEGCLSCSETTCIESCDSNVKDCVNSSSTALACKAGFYYYSLNSSCISKCENISGLYSDNSIQQCSKCLDNCASCPDNQQCSQCNPGYYLHYDKLTNSSQCLRSCSSLNTFSNQIQTYFPNYQNQTCNRCRPGCISCSSKNTCDACPPFSADNNSTGGCTCLFNHQFQILPSYKSIHVVTHDISWSPSASNTVLPCSVYFKARKFATQQCLPWSATLFYSQQKWDYSQIWNFAALTSNISFEIPDYAFLQNLNCEMTTKTQTIAMPNLGAFYEDRIAQISIKNISATHLAMIQKQNISLSLNHDNFARLNCDDYMQTYELRNREVYLVGGKVYQNAQNLSLTSQANDSQSMSNYSSVDIILNKQEFQIFTCSPQNKSSIDILFSRGFDSGFSQLYWQIQIDEGSSLLNNTLTKWDLLFKNQSSNSSSSMNYTGNQSISSNSSTNSSGVNNSIANQTDYTYINYTALQNQFDILANSFYFNLSFDISNLSAYLPENLITQKVSIVAFARNNDGILVKKVVNVTIHNYPWSELNLENQQGIPLAPQQYYRPRLVYSVSKCWQNYSIQTIVITNQSSLNSSGLQLFCKIYSQNQILVREIVGCILNPWDLYPYDNYSQIVYAYHSSTKKVMRVEQNISFSEVSPHLRIIQGSSLIQDPSQRLILEAQINQDVNLNWFRFVWTCTYFTRSDRSTGQCDPRLLQSQRDQTLIIEEGKLHYDMVYAFTVSVMPRYSKDVFSFKTIQVETLYSTSYKSERLLVSYDQTNAFNRIDAYFPTVTNFYCQKLINQIGSQALNITLYKKYPYSHFVIVGGLSQYLQQSANMSVLSIPSSLLKQEMTYVISCEFTNLTAKIYGQTQLEFTTHNFETQDSSNNLTLTADPLTGDAYSTKFQIQTQSYSQNKSQCQIQMINQKTSTSSVLLTNTELRVQQASNISLTIPGGSFNIVYICRDINGYLRSQNQTITATLDIKNMTQFNEMLLDGANLTDPNQVSDMLYLFLNLGANLSYIDSQVQLSFLSNSLKVLFLNNYNATQEMIDSSVTAKIQLLNEIADIMQNNIILSANDSLVHLAIDSYLFSINQNQSLSNNSSISIETRNKAGVVKVYSIIEMYLIYSSQLANKLLTMGQTLGIQNQTVREVYSAFLSNMDQMSGNLLVNYTVSGSYGTLTYAMKKFSQNYSALGNTSLLIPALSGSLPINFTLDLSDQAFSVYDYTIIKGNAFKRDSFNETLLATNIYANKTIERLASDVIVLSIDNSDYELPERGYYNLNKTEFSTATVYFSVGVDSALPSNSNMISKRFECRYLDLYSNLWIGNECQIPPSNQTSDSYFKCCSNHLSQFVVVEVGEYNTTPNSTNSNSGGGSTNPSVSDSGVTIEYTDNQFTKIVMITFDVYFIIFVIIGCCLDRTKRLTLYYERIDDKSAEFGSSAPSNQYGGGGIIQTHTPTDGYGVKIKEDADYEKWYRANQAKIEQQKEQMLLQAQQLAAQSPTKNLDNQVDHNQSLDNSNYPIMSEFRGDQQLAGIPMDPRIRPPINGHKVSEQDQEPSQPQRKHKRKKNREPKPDQYEGGSSEDENYHSRQADSTSKAIKIGKAKGEGKIQAKQMKQKHHHSSKLQAVQAFTRNPAKPRSVHNNEDEEQLEVHSYVGSYEAKAIKEQVKSKKSSKDAQLKSRANERTVENTNNNNSHNPPDDTKSNGVNQINQQEHSQGNFEQNERAYVAQVDEGLKTDKLYKKHSQDSYNSSSADHDHVRTDGEAQDLKQDLSRDSKGQKVLPSRGMLQPQESDSEQSVPNEPHQGKSKISSGKRNAYEVEDEGQNQYGSGARAIQGPSDRNSNSYLNKNQYGQHQSQLNGSFHSQVTACEIFGRAIKCYSRTVGIVYREAPFQSRYIRIASAVAQYFLVLLLTGMLVVVKEAPGGHALIVTLVIMRGVQILFNMLSSKYEAGCMVSCRNVLCGIVFTILVLLLQFASMRIEKDKLQSQVDDWKRVFIPTFIIEFLIIDLAIIPSIIVMLLRCCCCSRTFFNFLSPTLTKRYLSIYSDHLPNGYQNPNDGIDQRDFDNLEDGSKNRKNKKQYYQQAQDN